MPTHACTRRLGREGVTLIEIIVVMAIMALLASMAAPKIKTWVYNSANQGALNRVASDLNLTRMRAIRTSRRAVLAISADGTSYAVVVDPTGTPDTLKKVSLSRDYPALDLTPHGTSVTFDSRGMTLNGTTTTLTASKGTRSSTLTVTGVGRIYRAY